MLFQENPFYLLHAHSIDGEKEISELAEDACLESDSDEEENQYREAENILINPRKRVLAEVFWLCGMPKEKVYTLIKEIQTANTDDNQWRVKSPSQEEIAALSLWNQYLYHFNRNLISVGRALSGDILKRMDDIYESVSISDLKDIINNERRKAHITLIQDENWVREGKEKVLQETLYILRKKLIAVNPLWAADLVLREVQVSDNETEFLDKIVQMYQECHGERITESENWCYQALSQIEQGNIQNGLNLLSQHFSFWASMIKPLNEYGIKFSDGCIPRVWNLLVRLRTVAVNRNNKNHDVGTALELTNFAVRHFSKEPELGPQFLKDQAVLQEMMNEINQMSQRNANKNASSGITRLMVWLKGNGMGWIAVVIIVLLLIGGVFDAKKKQSIATPVSSPAVTTQSPQTTKPIQISSSKGVDGLFADKKEEITYEKPERRGTVFSMAEIRWAVREQIRLDTLKSMNLNNTGIDAYNEMVDEYNRCASEFKYRRGNYETARKQVYQERSQIEQNIRDEAISNGWVD